MPRTNRKALISVSVAIFLVVVGTLRYATDLWCDADPDYWVAWKDHWLRYLIRAPSDGTPWGDLNAQFFKILSIPCAMSAIYLWFRRRYRSLAESAWRWNLPWTRPLWIGTFFVAFTAIEIEKAYSLFGTQAAGILPGENFWVNHVVHAASAWIAWEYTRRLSFAPVFPPDGDGGDRQSSPSRPQTKTK